MSYMAPLLLQLFDLICVLAPVLYRRYLVRVNGFELSDDVAFDSFIFTLLCALLVVVLLVARVYPS